MTTEGRIVKTTKAVQGPGVARLDWHIIRALSEVLDVTLPYETEQDMQQRMEEYSPIFEVENELPSNTVQHLFATTKKKTNHEKEHSIKEKYPMAIKNYYQTDVLSNASPTMAACVKELKTDHLIHQKGVEALNYPESAIPQ